jgi:hypothetical protein
MADILKRSKVDLNVGRNKPVRALSAGLVFPALRLPEKLPLPAHAPYLHPCRQHPPWLTPGGLIPAYIEMCITTRAPAWEPA